MAKKVSFSLASVRECVRLGYIHVVARPNLFKNVVLWGCVRLLGSISYTSSQLGLRKWMLRQPMM